MCRLRWVEPYAQAYFEELHELPETVRIAVAKSGESMETNLAGILRAVKCWLTESDSELLWIMYCMFPSWVAIMHESYFRQQKGSDRKEWSSCCDGHEWKIVVQARRPSVESSADLDTLVKPISVSCARAEIPEAPWANSYGCVWAVRPAFVGSEAVLRTVNGWRRAFYCGKPG